MAITTAEDLILIALGKTGVDDPSSDQKAKALDQLNGLISSLSTKDLIVPAVTDETFNLTIGTTSYTIGSGGDFDTAIPKTVVSAFLRDTANNYDSPLEVYSLRDYDSLTSKTTSGKPTIMYIIPGYPLLTLLFNYSPDAAYELHLKTVKAISEFSSLSSSYDLPPEYKRMLIFNLTVEIASDEDYQLSPEVIAIANASRLDVQYQMAKMRVPPTVELDSMFVSGGGYNIFTDE